VCVGTGFITQFLPRSVSFLVTPLSASHICFISLENVNLFNYMSYECVYIVIMKAANVYIGHSLTTYFLMAWFPSLNINLIALLIVRSSCDGRSVLIEFSESLYENIGALNVRVVVLH
jgi:hypothetical protein